MSTPYRRFCDFVEKLVHGKYLARISELERTLDMARDNNEAFLGIHNEDQRRLANQTAQLRAKESKLDRIKVLLEVERTLAREDRIAHLTKRKALEQRCLILERKVEVLARYSEIPDIGSLSEEEREIMAELLPPTSNIEPRDKIVIDKKAHRTNGVESLMGRLANVPYVKKVKYLGETSAQTGTGPKLGTTPSLIILTYRQSESYGARIFVRTTAQNRRQGEYVLELVRRVS